MNVERLVAMANAIGSFFESEPDREEAVKGIHAHIQRFWEPRMRRQILAYATDDGSELKVSVREAVLRLGGPA